ncbi:FKBP-type peptidyl-prolyl cis-trans isomerase [Halomonas sp. McH1-25]|uniref:FKBP-type peptidyl-prolyl cis-trans isomerase n=1 Tax=unclassified Halomonas TaxID=2609666 RepID=UPI001EF4AD85|nr:MULTISPECIES: FKBP-type peptidyl-prolyl cis-trans isomerase [unclassified Halomonas]MCG7599512.1 FKBP-type peptidyl-prolyl cis-trans isomerase [Halomonas sp. McH1-25]MCP1343667.1 FKBP-type peptidyl-prolyl cis-trans isomerase [Halomonas sp. FL8]MCP1361948.1 FKBP-type peptidyl-prolyl cis-trans isomerase [Halomonas sp. BBD45]MCP1366535.1 FKBP-type peptidyl-prolyl cis-trans isomerase [Halomonas sp. BBD48]
MKTLLTAAAFTAAMSAAPFVLAAPESDQEKLSYSIGVTLGQSLSQDVENLDIDAFTQALEDVYADDELQMSQEEMAQALTQFQQQKMAEQQAKAKQAAETNKAEGEKFLAENAEKEGVKVTDSGLQYKELESGDGATPGPQDNVKVHYEGKLLDGTVFDSSYERGEPVEFRVDQVIEGWQEALQMMSVGDTWMIYLPSDLAYGQAGTGGPIGPNETLSFKVELLGVEPAGGDSDDATSDQG